MNRNFKTFKIGYIIPVTLFMPGLGIILAITLCFLFNKKAKLTIDDFEVSSLIKGDAEEHYLKLNIEKESNIVPIEEALLINSKKIKRSQLINALKHDLSNSSTFLKKALNDNDTETSHYAAAALMELTKKLMVELQDLSVKFEANRDDIEISTSYADVIKRYIESGLLDERSKYKYKYLYIQILTNINRINPLKKEYFVERINTEIDLKEYRKAAETSDLLMNIHRDSEESYLMQLKLWYVLGDKAKFNLTIENLKNSKVKLSYQMLNKLRFWLSEV